MSIGQGTRDEVPVREAFSTNITRHLELLAIGWALGFPRGVWLPRAVRASRGAESHPVAGEGRGPLQFLHGNVGCIAER